MAHMQLLPMMFVYFREAFLQLTAGQLWEEARQTPSCTLDVVRTKRHTGES